MLLISQCIGHSNSIPEVKYDEALRGKVVLVVVMSLDIE